MEFGRQADGTVVRPACNANAALSERQFGIIAQHPFLREFEYVAAINEESQPPPDDGHRKDEYHGTRTNPVPGSFGHAKSESRRFDAGSSKRHQDRAARSRAEDGSARTLAPHAAKGRCNPTSFR
jgi:hypothetical protein